LLNGVIFFSCIDFPFYVNFKFCPQRKTNIALVAAGVSCERSEAAQVAPLPP